MHMEKDKNESKSEVVRLFEQFQEVLFKINNLLLPFFVMWAVWVTNEIYELRSFKSAGPRFTQTDSKNLELSIKQWTSENFLGSSYKTEIVEQLKEVKETLKILTSTITELKIELSSNGSLRKNSK